MLLADSNSTQFASGGPRVRLLVDESAGHPFALAVAAAWTCYGPRPASVESVIKLVDPHAEPDPDPTVEADRMRRRDRAFRLYADLFAAGHHTTFQHATFVFAIDNVSRLAIWSFFHSHPFYNSEQVSQRYREVSGKNVVTPELPDEAAAIYAGGVDRSMQGYRRLTELLTPDFQRDYADVFPARAKARGAAAEERFNSAVQKRAQEVARYVLPLATPTHLFHTVNALTLLRYLVLVNQQDAPAEVREVVHAMVRAVLEIDPNFLGSPEHPLDLRLVATNDTVEQHALDDWRGAHKLSPDQADAFCDEFDRTLGTRQSVLVSYPADGEKIMADAVRVVLGLKRDAICDSEAIASVLDGSKNPYLGHPLYLAMNSKLMQTMNHITMTFQKRISGAEDAQNQRHRGTPGSRPLLTSHIRRQPDVIVPWAVARNADARREYDATITEMWSAKNALMDQSVSGEWLSYLLPNSHQVRFVETGSLLTYYWKWIKRLCYDAQREISATARVEVEQVRAVFPVIGQYIDGPPCVMRARSGVKPICPEGERYCGIPVWRDYAFETLEQRRKM